MRRSIILLFAAIQSLSWTASVFAATDGIYALSETVAVWDGSDADRTKPVSSDYNFTYGDEESLTYVLPWNFSFYGQSYSQITVDTNGNIWFGATTAANSFNLPAAGRGPVSAAWNDDLSSVYDGGVFIQHKTNPERVVIEWRTETYTDEGNDRPNSFEIVLFQNGNIRFDYQSFAVASAKDFGTGISKDDTTHYLSVTANYANAFTLASRSFSFNPAGSGTVLVTVDFTGTGQGSVTSTPSGIACNTDCSAPFTGGNEVILHSQASSYSSFGGWSGGSCSGTGDCIVTPNVDTTIIATFTYDVTHQVQLDSGTQTFYSSIQSAYDAAAEGAIIKLWATSYSESLTCSRPVTVTLQGGYNSGYTAIIGDPVLTGVLSIAGGTAIVDGVSVQ
jgi:hypothetical protein